MTRASVCGANRSITRSSKALPPMHIRPLSPPPMRRASPPARITPTTGSSIVPGTLAHMLWVLLLDVLRVGVEDDTFLARQRDEPLAPRPPDESEPRPLCELDTRRREPRARRKDRNAHLHALDHHLGGEPAGRVEYLVGRLDAVEEHPAGNLVRGIVPAHVFEIDENAVALRQ